MTLKRSISVLHPIAVFVMTLSVASCGGSSAPKQPVLDEPIAKEQVESATTNESNGTSTSELHWTHSETAAFSDAKQMGKGVMIDFEATWCMPCKKLGAIFKEPEVAAAIQAHFIPLKFDVSESTETDEALQARYNAMSLPAILFLNADGTEMMRYANVDPTAENVLEAIEQAAGMLIE